MSWLERQFQLKEHETNGKTEALAGITTFITMSYIIFVNPSILQNTGMPFGAVMTATCLASALGSFLMAFLANYPIALAPGMGLNAFFTFSVVIGMGVSWEVALGAVFVEGVIFILLTFAKVRESIVNGIPQPLKIGISAGIGLFIAFIGLQGAGIVVDSNTTLVALGNLERPEVLLSLLGFFIMVVLEARKVRGAILWGILAVTIVAVLAGVAKTPQGFIALPPSLMPVLGKMDFSELLKPNFWIVVLSFFFVDFFDTVGTLVGVANRAGLLDSRGNLPRVRNALMADAVATTAGAALGTSTVTSYIESASGVEQGGKTGLTALVTGALFLLALFFSPLVAIVPSCATAPALVMVGIFMVSGLKELDFGDWTTLVPAFMALLAMPFTYSIANGIEFGVVSYVLLKVGTGKAKDVSIIMYALSVLFVLKELYF